MDRRKLLGTLGAAAVGLATGRSVLADDKDDKSDGSHGGLADKVAYACAECMIECSKGRRHCIKSGKMAKCAELCADCAECCECACHCGHGPLAAIVCAACAKACGECATECEKFADNEVLKKCAKACRDCEKACQTMAKH